MNKAPSKLINKGELKLNTLYDITNEYIEILNCCYMEETLSEELVEKLENIDETFNEKAKNISLVISELKAECKLINEEIERLKGRFETKIKNSQYLESYLKDKMIILNKSRIETPLNTISLRKSIKTEVTDNFIKWAIENHKESFLSKKLTYTPNKKLLKEEIEKGNLDCPYVEIVEHQNLIIK